MTTTTEKVIFGRKPNDAEGDEKILLTHAENYDLEKVIPIIEADGWIIRIVEFDLLTPPDFTKTIA